MQDVWSDHKIQFSTLLADFYFDEDILFCKIRKVQHSSDNLLEHLEALKVFLDGRRPNTYFDAENLQSVGNKERKVYKDILEKTFKKIAVYSNTPAKNTMINMYLGLMKPAVPTRLFHDQSKAIEWLK